MPIAGMTDQPPKYIQLGKIKKGTQDPQTGKMTDLDYFRVVFYDNSKACEEEFKRAYEQEPRELNIMMPYPDMQDNWDANYECWSGSGLVAMASTWVDKVTGAVNASWLFYRDYNTKQVMVRYGMPVGEEGKKFVENPIDITAPIYSYQNKKKEIVHAYLEPTGHLSVIIPELAKVQVGVFEFVPKGIKDIKNISSELKAFDIKARSIGKDLLGIPMKLIRREEEGTININGKLSRKKSWVVHLEVGGQWDQKVLQAQEQMALPDVVQGEVVEEGEQNGRVFRTDAEVLQALVDHALAADVDDAKFMMEACAWEYQPLDKFILWATVLRGWLDADTKFEIAVEKTNKGEKPI